MEQDPKLEKIRQRSLLRLAEQARSNSAWNLQYSTLAISVLGYRKYHAVPTFSCRISSLDKPLHLLYNLRRERFIVGHLT